MATIDLIVLGMLKKEPMSAYDIQKLVEYRNISKWVKISTPSIIKGKIIREGKMPEKSVYSLTEAGEKEFERLMFEISSKPIHIFLDFNAVIVNLDSLPLKDNLQSKENMPGIPETGMAVLRQQLVLAEAIEAWIESLKK